MASINLIGLIAFAATAVILLGSELLAAYPASQFAGYFRLTVSGYLLVTGLSVFSIIEGRINFLHKNITKALSAAAILLCITQATAALMLPGLYQTYVKGSTPSAQEKLRYAHGPFLQFPAQSPHSLDTGGVTIWWFDPSPGSKPPSVEVSYRRDMSNSRMFTEKTGMGKRRRSVAITGLSAGKTCYYRIPRFDLTARSFVFPDKNTESVRFTIIGDVSNHGNFKHSHFRELALVTRRFYQNQGQGPAMALLTGDLANRGSDIASWEIFLTSARPLLNEIPAVIPLGNHETYDDRGGNRDYLLDQPRYGAFDLGPIRVIYLHNFDSFSGINGLLDSAQYRFLERELGKAAGRRWIMVSLHVSPVSTGDFNMNKGLMKQYLPLFRKYRVDLVTGGHDHHFDAFWMDRDSAHEGTFIVINGGGGSRLDSYIMTRRKHRWKTWYHDRTAPEGLYQHDPFTKKYHVYGELSWGFCDVEVKGDSLKVTYYRWLELPRYRELTRQKSRITMHPFSREFMDENKLWSVEPVLVLEKKRVFK